MRLTGKIALITAAASGIGRAGAVLLAREGASVAVADIDKVRISDTVAEITKAGGKAHGIPCDLMREADCRRIVKETVAAFGGLDIVWNNVGHPGPGRVEGLDMDDFDIALTLNVRSVLATTTEAIPAMRARGGGSILFTSSIAGIRILRASSWTNSMRPGRRDRPTRMARQLPGQSLQTANWLGLRRRSGFWRFALFRAAEKARKARLSISSKALIAQRAETPGSST